MARTETPMMKQFGALKAKAPGALLFFRMGDFYELFLEDAEIAAPLLDLVLTTRDKDAEDPIPMCGVPFHAAEGYIRRLLELGHSVAIGEQVEDPKLAKGLVRREIVEIITPGLVANGERLSSARANYLATALAVDGQHGFAYADVSTGEFVATAVSSRSTFQAELARIAPRELVVPAGSEIEAQLPLREVAAADFDPARAEAEVGRLPEGLNVRATDPGSRAASALWMLVATFQPAALAAISTLRRYRASDRMLLDAATRRHLELVANTRDGGVAGTLLETLDRTRTPMGRRELVRRIGEPLLDPDAVRKRQEEIAPWLEPDSARQRLAQELRRVGDLERILSRIALPGVGPREIAALRASLAGVAAVARVAALRSDLADLHAALDGALVDEPPAAPRGEPHTGYIRDGIDAELDRIRAESEDGHRFLASLEERERTRTGIHRLRVKYTRVFGYAIEVSKAQAAKVPPEYRRKQTTANAERFTTDELERWEGVVLRARENAAAAEARVLEGLRAHAEAQAPLVREVAREIAAYDVAQSLAEVARQGEYVRPELDDSTRIEIEAGRHPTAERLAADGFVPNDVTVDADGDRLLILTGPNMAGKSTLLRQVGLIVLLAQMGAWVPARQARIGVVDRIFTRVGASDSLLTGESTFMVEMRETATILREATRRSLVLLDEVGRGTSTFDGLSIAWAVAEYLHDTAGLGARTLFATHYHELADLARTRDGVRNFHFVCAERGGEILFLRRMEPGAASRSYGIEVARHAGLPRPLVRRAREILENLEGGEFDERGRPRLAREAGASAPAQLTLFDPPPDPVRRALAELDPDRMTPVEALVELARLRALVEDADGGR